MNPNAKRTLRVHISDISNNKGAIIMRKIKEVERASSENVACGISFSDLIKGLMER